MRAPGLRKANMTRGVLAALLVALLPSVSPAQQPLFSPQQDPVAGERVFNDKGCVRCHAINGAGGTLGPDLGRTKRPRTFFDLSASIWNHAPNMAARMRELGMARPALDAREAGDLVAYLYTLNYFDAPGRPSTGRKLFTEKRCAACHAVGGDGGSVGPGLSGFKTSESPIALAATLWNHGPQMSEVMKSQNVPRPVFKGSEMRDLIAYINAASPRSPRGPLTVMPGRSLQGYRLFVDKGCAGCHQAGDKPDAPPNLAERQAQRSLTDFATAMWNKAPAMTAAMQAKGVAIPTLSPEEMSDIVAYLYSVRYFKQAGDPRRGVITSVNKGCFDCHALFGERGKTASDLAAVTGIDTPAGVMAALWKHTIIDDPRPLKERRWPTFRGEDMADLVAYLRTLKRTP
jgi:mono/diheme cytochrome c family protein